MGNHKTLEEDNGTFLELLDVLNKEENTDPKFIHLHNCNISNEGLIRLVVGFKKMNSIVFLDLYGNSFNDVGFNVFLNDYLLSKKALATITDLHLGKNELSEFSLKMFCERYLKNSTSLKRLHLQRLKINDDMFECILRNMPEKTMEVLILCDNCIQLDSISCLFVFNKLLNNKNNFPNLKVINLKNNKILMKNKNNLIIY